ncbi:MAG: bifunctional oligoribonuclease/PAP phosphatase NrnA [Clostridia bacterium]|nr:bifunctional oligoribonuclease/PAP phosphatase NrnA [Clostridia bacterium]
MTEIVKIKEQIKKSDKITIVSHCHPDGDALGSQIALALGLEQLGMEVTMINKDPVPQTYRFLKNWELIKPHDENTGPSALMIFLDCATLDRVGYPVENIVGSNSVVINIDHHISNTNFGHLNWVEPSAAATAELIYDLLGLLHVKIDKDIATALYTGISTDTGSFLYENTTATTHLVVSDLINRGADVGLVRLNYYENINISKINLLKYILNNLKFCSDNKICWAAIKQYDFASSGATDQDTEGLINYLKNISGVEVAIIFREMAPEQVKVSFRSKKWADVNLVAEKFGGGGHPRASGCTVNEDLDKAISSVLRVVMESVT